MVVLHVIEERRETDVSWSGVRDDPARGETSHTRRGVGRGEHHDSRTIFGAGSHLGPEPVLSCPGDQILGERRCHPTNGGDPDFVDVVEAPELRVDGRQRRCAQLEAAIVGASRRASSPRTYSSTIPGPPSSHLSPPAVRKSTPAAFSSTGTCPTDW